MYTKRPYILKQTLLERACSSDKMIPMYLLCLSKVWSILHHELVERVQKKECYFMLPCVFLAFLVIFHHKICVFIIFISFFDEASNFCHRISTNKKQELVIYNSQWNYMQRRKLLLEEMSHGQKSKTKLLRLYDKKSQTFNVAKIFKIKGRLHLIRF